MHFLLEAGDQGKPGPRIGRPPEAHARDPHQPRGVEQRRIDPQETARAGNHAERVPERKISAKVDGLEGAWSQLRRDLRGEDAGGFPVGLTAQEDPGHRTEGVTAGGNEGPPLARGQHAHRSELGAAGPHGDERPPRDLRRDGRARHPPEDLLPAIARARDGGAEQAHGRLVEVIDAARAVEEDEVRQDVSAPVRALQVEPDAVPGERQEGEDRRKHGVNLEVHDRVDTAGDERAERPDRAPREGDEPAAILDDLDPIEDAQDFRERNQGAAAHERHRKIRIGPARAEQGGEGEKETSPSDDLDEDDLAFGPAAVLPPEDPSEQPGRGFEKEQEHPAEPAVQPLLTVDVHRVPAGGPSRRY